MEYLNRKWFEVVWSLKISPLKKYSDEIEADSMTEAEEIVTRLYGTYENDFDDVIIHYSREIW